ncbi:DUF4339 domain-containing protein [Rubinisphaera margarita]|uniref:DUF4339 domain-containing protein n=1 Tax=Rubinisphaera margarita TaxID=2909586 RepID=UPI001EE85B98|nr:DUF4339 domain-containing protein [Rubinisphaera margarita]MCG6154641.1 DUF4339 domain-containing protein [Rubinisphaera margarita]
MSVSDLMGWIVLLIILFAFTPLITFIGRTILSELLDSDSKSASTSQADSPSEIIPCVCPHCLAKNRVLRSMEGYWTNCDKCGEQFQVSELIIEKIWLCRINGQKSGPFSSDQVKLLIQSGELRAEDMIRKKSQKEWKQISSVKRLASALKDQPPRPKQSALKPVMDRMGITPRGAIVFGLGIVSYAFLMWLAISSSTTSAAESLQTSMTLILFPLLFLACWNYLLRSDDRRLRFFLGMLLMGWIGLPLSALFLVFATPGLIAGAILAAIMGIKH